MAARNPVVQICFSTFRIRPIGIVDGTCWNQKRVPNFPVVAVFADIITVTS